VSSAHGGLVGGGPTLLDAGLVPVEPLATLGWREARRPRPIYGAHRWFARRLGTSFRALLVAAALPPDADFFPSYQAGVDLAGMTVLDPFVGGGTSVVEAQRLGATTVGVDVDPVACAITAFEARAHHLTTLDQAVANLARDVGGALAPYYRTATPDGEPREVLHNFWVQVVACPGCDRQVECHPHYQLAHEVATDRQWVLCATCHAVAELPRSATALACAACGTHTELAAGPGRGGRLRCPACQHQEPLISIARRSGGPPTWRLVATETIQPQTTEPLASRRPVPIAQRRFQAATPLDLELLAKTQAALAARTGANGTIRFVPDRAIPSEARADDRLLAYGYRHYRELFNPASCCTCPPSPRRSPPTTAPSKKPWRWPSATTRPPTACSPPTRSGGGGWCRCSRSGPSVMSPDRSSSTPGWTAPAAAPSPTPSARSPERPASPVRRTSRSRPAASDPPGSSQPAGPRPGSCMAQPSGSR
jgi:hypothetical protein